MQAPSARPRQAAAVPSSVGPRHAVDHHGNLRLQGWDYTSPGWYFLTLCTQNMRSVFGTVVNGRMALNASGTIAEQCWRKIPAHFPRAVLDEFVVMPNHVHGLLRLVGAAAGRDRVLEAFGKPVAGSVPTILRSYKSAVTRALGERPWQSRFYDVRPRDAAALETIRAYIRHNPESFAAVMQGTEPKYLGNRALLDMPKVGFLASRSTAERHGHLPLGPDEVVISGFLSPMEQAVFKACLAHRRPMIWVTPTACRGATEDPRGSAAGVPPEARHPTAALPWPHGVPRGLMVAPFPDAPDTPNARRAVWCNQYVIEHCDRLVIGHLNPDGMLACLLSEADPQKEIVYL